MEIDLDEVNWDSSTEVYPTMDTSDVMISNTKTQYDSHSTYADMMNSFDRHTTSMMREVLI